MDNSNRHLLLLKQRAKNNENNTTRRLLAALAREKRSALEMESVDDMLAPRKRIKVRGLH